ncbi:hypothetical protein N0X72_06295 [Streptomyces carpaticus]|uniref:hypothetical protein n=1 Tax=Streptomyces carpaticus TaxID=285558 RepID=UPI00220AC8DC|nr:hypothetical protein N0X72_06295 [Streptomyces carpaticus]
MGITSGPGIRAARAAIFSALCVALASAAHVLLSGAPLPLPTVTAVTAAVFVLAYVLAGSGERGYWRIAGLLLPLQLAADTIFTAGQAACYGTGDEPFPRQLRFLGLDLICAGGDFGTPLARLAAGDQAPLATPVHPALPWLLLGAHLGIGLAAAGWLRCGEAALARLLHAAVAATFRPLLLAAAVHRAAATAGRAAVHAGVHRHRPLGAGALLTHSVTLRGPPCDLRLAA